MLNVGILLSAMYGVLVCAQLPMQAALKLLLENEFRGFSEMQALEDVENSFQSGKVGRAPVSTHTWLLYVCILDIVIRGA
jgi:hypothetical protein